MNSQLIETLDKNVARLNEIRAIIEREPAFARWHTLGGFETWLVQLFPDVAFGTEGIEPTSYPIHERQRDAKAIARALGGHWERHLDGSWHRERGNQGEAVVLRVILHRVDFDKAPAEVSYHIDLNAP
jgi:hypothetical protein